MLKRFNVKCPYCEAVVSCEMLFAEDTHHQVVTCQECDLPLVVRYGVSFHHEALGLADYMDDNKKEFWVNKDLKQSMADLRESAENGPKIASLAQSWEAEAVLQEILEQVDGVDRFRVDRWEWDCSFEDGGTKGRELNITLHYDTKK